MSVKEKIIEILKAYTKKHNIAASSVILEEYAEELLANGVIVPPCKLNQTMWKVTNTNIDKCRVSGITQKADGSFKIRLTHSRYRGVFEITVDRIGEDIFLTKEEAEQKLKELKNDA